jgi:hypothetical protein
MGADGKFIGLSLSADVASQKMRGAVHSDFFLIADGTPAWLAEGLAQWGSHKMGYDSLDGRRNMLLHQAAKDGSLLSLAEMATFSGDARSSELVYAQGFSLVDWMYRKFGQEKINISLNACQKNNWHQAIKLGIGISIDSIYSSWRMDLKGKVNSARVATAEVSRNFTRVSPILPYVVESHPVRLRSGHLCYASSSENAYGMPDLRCRDKQGRDWKAVHDIELPIHVSQDGEVVIYTASRLHFRSASRIRDAFSYDPVSEKSIRLTKNARVYSATLLQDSTLFGISTEAGMTRIQSFRKGQKLNSLTASKGQEFRDITTGRTDSELLVTVVQNESADIYALNRWNGNFQPLIATSFQEIHPLAMGDTILFSSDRDGSHAIYAFWEDSLQRVSPKNHPLFTPGLPNTHDQGRFMVSQYQEEGFRLVSLPFDGLGNVQSFSHLGASAIGDSIGFSESVINPSGKSLSDRSPSISAMGFNTTKTEILGYALMMGYQHSPPMKLADEIEVSEDEILTEVYLNPCSHLMTMGGATQWMDIGESQSF